MKTQFEQWMGRNAFAGYVFAVLAVGAATALFLLGRGDFATGQWGLLYLLVVLLVAGGSGAGPGIVAASMSFFAWDFFFIPPYGSLNVASDKDWMMLLVFLLVGMFMGIQTGRMRDSERRTMVRERDTVALERVSSQLVSRAPKEAMADVVLGELIRATGAAAANLYVRTRGGSSHYRSERVTSLTDASAQPLTERGGSLRRFVARWAGWRDAAEGRSSMAVLEAEPRSGPFRALPDGDGLYLPLAGSTSVSGILTIDPRADGSSYSALDRRVFASISHLAAAYLEREQLEDAAAAQEADRLTSSLLSSVSHELKTPLTALTATVSNLLESDVEWDRAAVRAELESIVVDASRLNTSIGELLDVSRLEARAWAPQRGPCELADVILAALQALPASARSRVRLELADDLPALALDYAQWVRVFQNLLENAWLYAGAEGAISVRAGVTDRTLRISVEDNGPGVPEGEREAVFRKFYRSPQTTRRALFGTGLGLAITHEIVGLHGGTIHVDDVAPHGADFVIELPLREGLTGGAESPVVAA
jgi:two-component system sensor histidine kinase KdpD